MDTFDVLDCGLRSRYVAPEALSTLPIWGRLPTELREALAPTLSAGKPLSEIIRLIWTVRAERHGKPEGTAGRTQTTAALRLGLLALRHQEGRLEVDELLTRAFHVADSYVCGIDPRPFLRLRRELESGAPDDDRVGALFAPYTAPAEQCVQQWGLRPSATQGEQRQVEPDAAPDPAAWGDS